MSPTPGKLAATKKKNNNAKHSKPAAAKGGGLKPTERKNLETIALFREVFGMDDVQRNLVSLFAGYDKRESPGFVKVLGTLKKNGYIEYSSKQTVRLTASGIAAAGPVTDSPPDTAEVHQRLKSALKPTEARVFDALSDGNAHTRDHVAKETNYSCEKQSGFVKVLGKLKTLGIVEYPGKTTARLTDLAFPFGRTKTSSAGSTKAFSSGSTKAATAPPSANNSIPDEKESDSIPDDDLFDAEVFGTDKYMVESDNMAEESDEDWEP